MSTPEMSELLDLVVEEKASDLHITVGLPPVLRIHGGMQPLDADPLTPEDTERLMKSITSPDHQQKVREHGGTDFGFGFGDKARFRVSVLRSKGNVGIVLRQIPNDLLSLEQIGLPAQIKELLFKPRGLVLVTGPTGSGKSTTLAGMLGHRNQSSYGHIITIEDPVEYVHEHGNCIVTHREVGVDTESWQAALKNTLRQAPDVILIGEIRDRETMEYAVAFAETGHLCMATLHANSANQALDRIINFFPEERREQLLMDLSLNVKALISQRLIPKKDGSGRSAAMEILLNSPLISDLIFKGDVHAIKGVMAKSRELGMQTFDQALFDLYESHAISYEEALKNADSVNDLRLKIKLESRHTADRDVMSGTHHLQMT